MPSTLLSGRPISGSWTPPSIEVVPSHVATAGSRAAELARTVGLTLLPWQEHVLALMLARRADGQWSSREFGLVVGRQNGKGEVIMARELFGLFVLGERRIIHSAHEFATSLEAFRRMRDVIEGSPLLMRRMKRDRAHGIHSGSGKEAFELQSGGRLEYRARHSGGAGRGLSGDLTVIDEAMYYAETVHGGLMPIISARPNPQIVYGLSAVDQQVHHDAHVVARARRRALSGEDPALGWAEWSLQRSLDDTIQVLDDEEAWAAANPSFPQLISREAIASERLSMDPRAFAVERLGVGDWPDPDSSGDGKIPMVLWDGLLDERLLAGQAATPIVGPVAFSFDVTPDMARAAVCVAGHRSDGLPQVEVIRHGGGTDWVAGRLRELVDGHECGPVRCDARGPAAALLPELARLEVPVQPVPVGEQAQAAAFLFGEAVARRLRHLGSRELASAVRGASTTQHGDAFTWSRRSSAVDISPLVAVTLALWAAHHPEPAAPAFSFVFDTYE
jgi:hypothetical protein